MRLAERRMTAVPENAPGMAEGAHGTAPSQRAGAHWEAGGIPAAPAQPAARWEAIEAASEWPAELDEPGTDAPAGHQAVRLPESKSSLNTGEPAEDLLADGKCPRCRRSKARVSRPRNRVERFLRAIG